MFKVILVTNDITFLHFAFAVPPKVANVRIVSIGANFITIAWDAPQNRHFEIETYEVLYNADGSTSENMSFGYTKQPNITLDSLLQQTKYAFKVSDAILAAVDKTVVRLCA
jgi:hypothetical protein